MSLLMLPTIHIDLNQLDYFQTNIQGFIEITGQAKSGRISRIIEPEPNISNDEQEDNPIEVKIYSPSVNGRIRTQLFFIIVPLPTPMWFLYLHPLDKYTNPLLIVSYSNPFSIYIFLCILRKPE